MDNKKETRPWWRLTLFDIVIIAAAIVVGAVLVWFTGMAGSSGTTGEEQGPADTGTLHYTIELRQMVGESAYLIQEGDQLLDRVRKYSIGTVVSVEVGDAVTYAHNMEEGTYVPVTVPGSLTATVVVESPYTVSGRDILVDGGYVIRTGLDVQVSGPGYAGSGSIITLERSEVE